MRNTLARSSLQTIASMGVRVLIQALALVIVTRALGPTIYGSYVAAASLAVILGLIPNLGAGYVLMERVAREPEALVDTWSYGWPLSLTIGIVFTAIFPWIGQMVSRGAIPTTELAVLGAAELVVTPLTLLLSFVLQAINRVPTAQWVLTIPLVLKLVAASVFVMLDGSSLMLFISMQAVATCGGLLAALAITSRIVPLRWIPRGPSRKELRIGANYAAMHVVAANPSELDKITSPLLLGDHAAGIYSATSRVMNALVMPVVGVLLASQPRLFRHSARPTDEGRRLISLLGCLALAWGLIASAIMAVTAPLLPKIFGAGYIGTASLMPWIATAAPFLSLRLAAGTVLVALGHPLQRLKFELIGVLLLGGSLFAGSQISGPRGMALALAFAELVMCVYGWLLVARVRRTH